MDIINKIIKESIDNFVLSEARLVDPNEAWANLYGGTTKQKRIKKYGPGGPPPEEATPRKRKVVKSLDDAETPNQIGRVLRNEWDCQALKNILSFNKNVCGMYGKNNANAFWNFFESTLTPFHTKYREVSKLTSDIENWARQGDRSGVLYRIKDLPKPLEELADVFTALYNKCQTLQKLAKTNDIPLPGGMKPSVINGYMTSHGLSSLVIYSGKPRDIHKITSKLRDCATLIRYKWGDNLGSGTNDDRFPIDMGHNELGITTKYK